MSANQRRQDWSLHKECELRCEVSENDVLTLKLTAGTAEIFGVEMALNRDYSFRDQNIAVFTWYGCTIESVLESATADKSTIYVENTTPMIAYANTHIQLEARRDVALSNSGPGPRVLICGPLDQGKSSLAQILTAYSIRLDRTPIFVDLDVSQSFISIPGTMGAIPLDKNNLNVEEGFSNFNPLIYFYGYTSPKEQPEFFKSVTSSLAKSVCARLTRDADANASGLIINTPGWDYGIEPLLHIVKEFAVDIILVMNSDRLYAQLLSAVNPGNAAPSQQKTVVVKLPSSGGVVSRDKSVRKRLQKTRIREYFYGRSSPSLGKQPNLYAPERRDDFPISHFNFFRPGGLQLTEGMKVLSTGDGGNEAGTESVKLLQRIPPTSTLSNSIVALLNTPESEDMLAETNVAGFVSLLSLDIDSDRMSVLTPCPGALPSRYFLVGGVKWIE